MSRRYMRVEMSFDQEVGKFELIAVLRRLPEDAKIIRMAEDCFSGTYWIMIESASFDPVPEGYRVPTFNPILTREAIEVEKAKAFVDAHPSEMQLPPGFKLDLEKLIGGKCICDLAYTGAKRHRKDCPQYVKSQ
jgi:hypothetical protein